MLVKPREYTYFDEGEMESSGGMSTSKYIKYFIFAATSIVLAGAGLWTTVEVEDLTKGQYCVGDTPISGDTIVHPCQAGIFCVGMTGIGLAAVSIVSIATKENILHL